MLTAGELELFVRRWKEKNDPTDSLVVLTASQVDAKGRARTSDTSQSSRRAALLPTLTGPAIVEALEGDAIAVELVFCSHGVLEIRGGELCITELARGVSATDLQALCVPTLKISHDVAEMQIDLGEESAPRQD